MLVSRDCVSVLHSVEGVWPCKCLFVWELSGKGKVTADKASDGPRPWWVPFNPLAPHMEQAIGPGAPLMNWEQYEPNRQRVKEPLFLRSSERCLGLQCDFSQVVAPSPGWQWLSSYRAVSSVHVKDRVFTGT